MRARGGLTVGFALGLGLALCASCLQPDALDCPGTCPGCCAADGGCQTGDRPAACGNAGATCAACGATQVCRAGACVAGPGGADGGADSGALADGGLADSGQPKDSGVSGPEDAGAPDASRPEVDPLLGVGAPALVPMAQGFVFTEGPLWVAGATVPGVPAGSLLFSDINNATPAQGRIVRLTPPNGPVDYRRPSGNANGHALDPQGMLVSCEHQNRRVSRTLADGGVVTVADRFDGGLLHSPNDVVVRSDGTLYFTDPRYGGNPAQLPFAGVFRVDLSGRLAAVDLTMAAPNGIALSPDEKTLYVSDSQDGLVNAYDVAPDGTVSNKRRFVRTGPGGATGAGGDGITVDEQGNLYVSTSDARRVKVYRTDGGERGSLQPPKQPTNCAFGGADGQTLFITAGDSVYQVHLNLPGRP